MWCGHSRISSHCILYHDEIAVVSQLSRVSWLSRLKCAWTKPTVATGLNNSLLTVVCIRWASLKMDTALDYSTVVQEWAFDMKRVLLTTWYTSNEPANSLLGRAIACTCKLSTFSHFGHSYAEHLSNLTASFS